MCPPASRSRARGHQIRLRTDESSPPERRRRQRRGRRRRAAQGSLARHLSARRGSRHARGQDSVARDRSHAQETMGAQGVRREGRARERSQAARRSAERRRRQKNGRTGRAAEAASSWARTRSRRQARPARLPSPPHLSVKYGDGSSSSFGAAAEGLGSPEEPAQRRSENVMRGISHASPRMLLRLPLGRTTTPIRRRSSCLRRRCPWSLAELSRASDSLGSVGQDATPERGHCSTIPLASRRANSAEAAFD